MRYESFRDYCPHSLGIPAIELGPRGSASKQTAVGACAARGVDANTVAPLPLLSLRVFAPCCSPLGALK